MQMKEVLRFATNKLYDDTSLHSNWSAIATSGNRTPVDGNSSMTVILIERLMRMKHQKDVYVNGTIAIGTRFSEAFLVLGVLAVILNVLVLVIILTRQRCACGNVFYLLLINFAIVDCLKGLCLIAYAFRMFDTMGGGDKSEPTSMMKSRFILPLKVDQFITLILRFCNIKTILNLLVLTLNEFLFIRYPLRYNNIVTRRTALFSLAFNWVVGLTLAIALTLIRARTMHVFIHSNITADHRSTMNSLLNMTSGGGGTSARTLGYGIEGLKRIEENRQDMDIHYIISFALTSFCIICLTVVLITYASFFRVIKQIRMKDAQLIRSANRRPSESSICSSNLLPNENVLTFKSKSNTSPMKTIPIRNDSQDIEIVLDERRIKRHLLKRYKYVIVIGLVIFVYLLYLITYATIQIMQYFVLKNQKRIDLEGQRKNYIVRWSLQILVGLHSVFQPLCCFRIKEIRTCLFDLVKRCGKFSTNRLMSTNSTSTMVASYPQQKISFSSIIGGANGGGGRNSILSGTGAMALRRQSNFRGGVGRSTSSVFDQSQIASTSKQHQLGVKALNKKRISFVENGASCSTPPPIYKPRWYSNEDDADGESVERQQQETVKDSTNVSSNIIVELSNNMANNCQSGSPVVTKLATTYTVSEL